jgi:brefeldin A-resistance guanine nucleotide exchange factor 1
MTFPPLAIIDPFLALVRSPLTSGPITSLALTSLHSLALHVLPLYLPATPPPAIGPASPLQIAMMHLTSALAQCRFPSSSPQQDELVLLRLLRIIEALTAPTAVAASSSRTPQSLLDNMNDEGVCELLEVGLGMLARGRLSEGLRSSAQMCVQAITRACFLRLRALRGEDVEIALRAAEESSKETTVHVPVERKLSEETPEEKSDEIEEGKGKEKEIVLDEKEEEKEQEPEKKDPEAKDTESKDGEPVPPQFVPYGLPTMLELLRVLIALLNPTDQAHTDSMRMSALAVLNAALEVGGGSIGNWPELREGVRDEGCRYLFQLTRSDSPLLLAQSLRTTSTLFSTLLPHLKLQLELFLSYLVDRLTPPTPSPLPLHLRAEALRPSRPGTPMQGGTTTADGGLEAPVDKSASSTPKPYALLPPVPAESKELWFETLTQIATQPSFMVDCWANFDCSTDSEDIFERMIGFLTRGVYPTGPRPDGAMVFEGLESPQLLCLEILLSFINSMANRLEDGDEAWPADAPMTPDELAASKSRKAVLVQGEIKFNIKPKDGIKFLEENGIIGPGEGPEPIAERRLKSIAHFLRSSSRLDKKLLGEYISRPDQVDLLKVFIGLFDFKGRTIADALRDLLETFRLPGESQPISRITEVFADHFFSFQPREFTYLSTF